MSRDNRGHAIVGILAAGLTITAGSVDAISFMRLGKVFSSVMTGNLVLLGVAASSQDAGQAIHVAVAVGGYLVGTAVSARIVAGARGDRHRDAGVWPSNVSVAVAVEAGVLVAVLAGWLATAGHPQHGSQLLLLSGTSVAMGVQSAAVRAVELPGLISTTYLTSTLTSVVAGLVSRQDVPWRGAVMLVALFAGAGAGAGLAVVAAPLALVLPCVAVVAVLAVAVSPTFRAVATQAHPSTG